MTVKTQDKDIASSTITLKDAITWAIILVGIVGSHFSTKNEIALMKLEMVYLTDAVKKSETEKTAMLKILQEMQADLQDANKRFLKYADTPDEENITPRTARRR